MILDEKGYEISRSHVVRFEKALADLYHNQGEYEDIDPRFLEVHQNTLRTQLKRIQKEIKEYESQNNKNGVYENRGTQMIQTGLILNNRYRVIEKLGQGGVSNTWEVDDQTQGIVKVLKVLTTNFDVVIKLFEREAEVLKRLNHPGVPKVESDGYFTCKINGYQQTFYCLVMEKIKGVNLKEWLRKQNHGRPIEQKQAIEWLKQIIQILAIIHDNKIIHRDIKPSNIMIKPDGNLVLIDFGAVREVTQTYYEKRNNQDITYIHSIGYTPPEQIRGQASQKSDFFALGRTFVYLLTAQEPKNFDGDAITGNLRKNWRQSAPQISSSLADLIDDLMNPEEDKRLTEIDTILLRLHILSIESSIQSSLDQMPRLQRDRARQIFQEKSKQWMKNIRPPRIALYGRSGAGKSSIINAIVNQQIAPVSLDKPCTMNTETYPYQRQGWTLKFIDSRGIGDTEGNEAFPQAINDIIQEKVDILLFVLPVDERNVGQDVNFLRELKTRHRQRHNTELPIILVFNKIDRVQPSREWKPPYNLHLDTPENNPVSSQHQKKETNIRACMRARLEDYQELTNIYVPVCTLWDEDEDLRYNITLLLEQIYQCMTDEATKKGFGLVMTDKSLKKAIANDLTVASSWLAFFAAILPFFDAKAVLNIQTNLVNMIARLADFETNEDDVLQFFLNRLGLRRNDAKEAAVPITYALGQAAIRYFIDKEGIEGVRKIYAQKEKDLTTEFEKKSQQTPFEIMERIVI